MSTAAPAGGSLDVSTNRLPTTSTTTTFGLTAALLCLAALIVVLVGCGGSDASTGPEQPTFDYVIPAGAGDRINAGEALDILPQEIVAELDETIQIVNHDDRAHLLGPWYVGPGETLRQRFTVPGVFDGACSVHPSGDFTVIVNE